MLPVIFFLMQYMVSAKAGLVNYVDGQVNVRVHEQITAGAPIETGLQSHVELLLNPGSFLRIGEDSQVVLDSVELSNIAVRIVKGAALIEASDIDKQIPIRVTTGNLQVLIVSPGTYRFSDGTALVLEESSARRINRRPLREATRSHRLATATQSATSLSSPMASWTSGVVSDHRLWRKRMRWHITTTTAATLTLFGTIRIGTYIPAGPPGFTARF